MRRAAGGVLLLLLLVLLALGAADRRAPAPGEIATASSASLPRVFARAALAYSWPRFQRTDESIDLAFFVAASAGRLDDPRTAYQVSEALEECHTLSESLGRPSPVMTVAWSPRYWLRQAAEDALLAPCRGFEGRVIDSREVMQLLVSAARQGDPRARARMLLFRDIAASKSDVIDEIPQLLALGDPAVVRDVGAFLSKGESSWRYGGTAVDATTAAIAWELAACELGYPCGAWSRLVLAQCAFAGLCDSYDYGEAIARQESPERMAEALRLRDGLVAALRRNDWAWLGLQ